MKLTAFNASCPFEIGDKIKIVTDETHILVITDIMCCHYIKSGTIEFRYELDNNNKYVLLHEKEMSMIKKGDKVTIFGSAEEELYKDCVFEVLSDPYNICGEMVAKIKCHETGKYFAGGYAIKFLRHAGGAK